MTKPLEILVASFIMFVLASHGASVGAQALTCHVEGGDAECVKPLLSEWECTGTFITQDGSPCGRGENWQHCRTEDEPIRFAMAQVR